MEFENLHLMPAPPPPRNPKPAEFIPTKRELQALDALHSKHAPGVAAIARMAPPCECFPWGWKSIPNRWLISGHRTASDFVVNLTWNSTSSILMWVSHSTRTFFYCDVYPGIWSVSPLPLQPCPLRSPSSSPSTERPAMPSLMQIDPTSSHPWSLFLSGKQWTWHLSVLGSLTVICIFFFKISKHWNDNWVFYTNQNDSDTHALYERRACGGYMQQTQVKRWVGVKAIVL